MPDDWIGYLMEATWKRPTDASGVLSTIAVHWEWAPSGTTGTTGGTSSSEWPSTSDDNNKICMYCSGEEGPGCLVADLQLAGGEAPTVCSNAPVVFTFTATSTDAGLGLASLSTPSVTPPDCSVTNIVPEDNTGTTRTYTVSCVPGFTGKATLLVTQTIPNTGQVCDDILFKKESQTATIKILPVITVESTSNREVCSKDGTQTFTFKITSTTTPFIDITSITPAKDSATPPAGCELTGTTDPASASLTTAVQGTVPTATYNPSGSLSPVSGGRRRLQAGATATSVATGSVITVTCYKGAGSWQDFNIGIATATETPGLSGCGDINDNDVFAIKALTQPTVTVRKDSAPEVCSTADSSSSTWTVFNDQQLAMQVALAYSSTTDVSCVMKADGRVIANQESVDDNTQITVDCEKKLDSAWPDSYNVKLTATAGDPDCPGQNPDLEPTTILTHWIPLVSVDSDDTAPVCTTHTGTFSFSAMVANQNHPKSTDQVAVTAAWTIGGTPVPCMVALTSGASGGSSVTVGPSSTTVYITCGTSTTTYTEGTSTVTVTGSAGPKQPADALTCHDEKSDTTNVVVKAPPAVTVDGEPTGAWCLDDADTFTPVRTYTIKSDPPEKAIAIEWVHTSPAAPHCSITGATPTQTPGTVVVTCSKGADWPTGDSFPLVVTAKVREDPCTKENDFTTNVALHRKPTVSVTGGDNQKICSATSVTINYGATVVPTFTPDWSFVVDGEQKDNVHCTGSGSPAQSYTVTCRNTDTTKVLPTGSFTVRVTALAGEVGCKQPDSKTTTITVVGCCSGPESSYAYGAEKKPDGTTFGTGTCFNNEMCGTSGNWGWRNELEAGTGIFDIYAGASASATSGVACTNRNKRVGKITVTCTNPIDGSGANVVVYKPDQQVFSGGNIVDLGLLDHHLYVGCKAWATVGTSTSTTLKRTTTTVANSPSCTPPSYNAPKTSLSTATRELVEHGDFTCGGGETALPGTGRCGGNSFGMQVELPVRDGITGMKVPGCQCDGIYWVYHQSAKQDAQFIYEPTNGVCN